MGKVCNYNCRIEFDKDFDSKTVQEAGLQNNVVSYVFASVGDNTSRDAHLRYAIIMQPDVGLMDDEKDDEFVDLLKTAEEKPNGLAVLSEDLQGLIANNVNKKFGLSGRKAFRAGLERRRGPRGCCGCSSNVDYALLNSQAKIEIVSPRYARCRTEGGSEDAEFKTMKISTDKSILEGCPNYPDAY